MKNWTSNEIQFLMDPSVSIYNLHKKMPHRSVEAIRIKANRLGYNRSGDALLRNSSNYLNLLHDNSFREIIDGELLGDGCITKNKQGYYAFTYCTANKSYCDFLHNMIAQKTHSKSKVHEYGPPAPHLNPRGKWVISKNSYQFGISHKVFKWFHGRWYSDKKHIPHDLQLTPTVCRHWYIGDGTIDNKKSLTIKLSTECFTKEDLTILVDKFSDLNISAKIYLSYEDRYSIAIYAANAIKFLKYIGKCPVDSYQYKWNTNGYRKRRKKCLCGKWFHFFSHTNRKFYCSSSCQRHYKSCNSAKRISNTKKYNLLHHALGLKVNEHFYYILGHALSTGNAISKSILSVKVLDPELILLIRDKLGYKHSSDFYDNTLSFQSTRLVSLFEGLSVKFDWSKIPKKHHGSVLRGIFDAAGMINLISDNYFQIVFRYQHASSLGKILGVLNPASNVLRVKKDQRSLVFDKMYIHDDEIRSKKKYDLFRNSLDTVRKSILRDEYGRFKPL